MGSALSHSPNLAQVTYTWKSRLLWRPHSGLGLPWRCGIFDPVSWISEHNCNARAALESPNGSSLSAFLSCTSLSNVLSYFACDLCIASTLLDHEEKKTDVQYNCYPHLFFLFHISNCRKCQSFQLSPCTFLPDTGDLAGLSPRTLNMIKWNDVEINKVK